MFVDDIRDEISEMQMDINNVNNCLSSEHLLRVQQQSFNDYHHQNLHYPQQLIKQEDLHLHQAYNVKDDHHLSAQLKSNELIKNEIKIEKECNSVQSISKNDCDKFIHNKNELISAVASVSSSRSMLNISVKKHDESSLSVKKEEENFDIESEITPSFIMKNSDYQNNTNIISNDSEFNDNVNHHITGNDESNNHHHNLQNHCINNLNSLNPNIQSQTHNIPSSMEHNHESYPHHHTSEDDKNCEPYDEWLCIQKELKYISSKRDELNNDSVKSVEKELSEIFDQSPKSVEKQLDEIFNPSSIKHHHHPNQSHHHQNSPLDFFHSEGQSKSIFDEDTSTTTGHIDKIDNSDIVESRLEALFQSTSRTGSNSSTNSNENFSTKLMQNIDNQQMNDFMMMPINRNNKLWNNNGERNFEQRWMIDCQQQQQQPQQQQQQHQLQYEYENRIEQNNIKRTWNGDMDIVQHTNKRHCYSNSKNINIDHELLGLTSGLTQNMIDQHFQQNLVSNSYDPSSSLLGQQNHVNDDDDINRHVQNAIDSILNLQNSDTDSLHFSLDPSMNSFLSDSPLPTTPRPPSVAKRKNTLNHHLSNKTIDDINDLLISGNNRDDMMIIDSPSSSMTPIVGDFGVLNDVSNNNSTMVENNGGNINNDDSCKSVLSS